MAGAISLPCRTYIFRAGNDKTDNRLRRCQDRRNPVSAYTYMELCILHMEMQTAAPSVSPLCSKPQNANDAHQSAPSSDCQPQTLHRAAAAQCTTLRNLPINHKTNT